MPSDGPTPSEAPRSTVSVDPPESVAGPKRARCDEPDIMGDLAGPGAIGRARDDRIMRRHLLVIMLLGMTVASCGGNEPNARGDDTSSPSSQLTSSGTPTTPAAKGSGTSSPRSSPRSTPRASPSRTFTPSQATLDAACVRRGVASDRQGVTVKTDPQGPASYVTVYSDGSTITDRPEEYSSGGQGGGFADQTGTYRDTWVVPAAAPTGRAVVRVVVAGRSTPIDLPFTVVAQTGRCP